MATYTDAKRNFDKYFAEAVSAVGAAKMQPGMEPNAVLRPVQRRKPVRASVCASLVLHA